MRLVGFIIRIYFSNLLEGPLLGGGGGGGGGGEEGEGETLTLTSQTKHHHCPGDTNHQI